MKKNKYLFTSFTKDDLKLFLNHVSIYRKGYNKETSSKVWIHVNSYLTDDILIRSILKQRKERADIAYSSCYMTNFFVLDLDCHKFYGKDYFITKDFYIRKQYSCIKNILGQASLVSSTPRGIHLYYFLKEKISVDTLHDYLREKLFNSEESMKYQTEFSDITLEMKNNGSIRYFNFEPGSIDIKPGIDSYVRSFAKSKLLHADNLTIYNKKTRFSYIINKAVTYSIGELFEDQLTKKSKNIVFSYCEQKDYTAIYTGHTNDALNYLIPLWKNRGYSSNQCAEMFTARLDPSYKGDCRNFNKLLKRIECYTTSIKIDRSVVTDNMYVKYKKAIDSAIAISNGRISNQHNREIRALNIKKIMCLIFSIKENTNNIKYNKRLFYKQCSENPYFALETSKNRIPIPSISLKSCVSNYEPILRFLKSINFITSNSTYSTYKKSCIYYSINELFNTIVYKIYNKIYKKFLISNILTSCPTQKTNICSNMFLVYLSRVSTKHRDSS